MSKEKSKVQKAIEHIYAHPGCRSDALSAIFQCEAKNVPAFMKDVLAAGLIVSCKVERPGRGATHEFKPSAAAPDKCPMDWLEWKRANIAPPVKPLHFKATGPRDGLQKSGSARETQAASGDITAAVAAGSSPSGKQHLPSSEAAIEAQAGSHGPEEATAIASAPAASAICADDQFANALSIGLHISLDKHGRLTLGELTFSPDETREIGEFLVATEPAWA
jgi:hypothetical protein